MPTEPKTSEGERLIKLTLYVKEHGPVDFATIRRGLHEYGFADGLDPEQEQRYENKVRRMFERDKTTLESCGIFIVADSQNQYSLDYGASFAAPVDLSNSESSLLRLACAALLEDDEYPFKSELRMVLVKIGDELEVPDLLPNMTLDAPHSENTVTGLKKARKAIAARKRLEFDYTDARGSTTSRSVEPFGCLFFKGACYIIAFDAEAQGERMFRLDRASHVRVNSTSPNTPDFEPRPFDPMDYVGLPFQYGTTGFTARVECDAHDEWRLRRMSMQQGTIEEEEDGRVVWTVEAKSAAALARWCIENGPGIIPREPAEAIDAYRDILKQACAESKGGAR